MYIRKIIFVILIVPFNSLMAQSYFNITIPFLSPDSNTRTESYNAILEIPGSGYLAFGNSWNYLAGTTKYIFDRIDVGGNHILQKSYGGNNDLGFPMDAHFLPDSTIGVLIDNFNSINDSSFFLFYIINDNGDTLKTFKYSSGEEICHPRKFINTSDGGFAMVGYSRISQSYRSKAFFLKTNSMGEVQWMTIYGDTSVYTTGTSLLEVEDGFFSIAWISEAPSNTYRRDVKLTRLDLLGNILWERNYGSAGLYDLVEQIIKNSGNSFSMIGTRCMGPGQVDNPEAWYLEIDSIGNILRNKHYGGSADEELNNFVKRNNKFYCSGSYQVQTSGYHMGYLLALDEYGDSLWSRSYVFDTSSNYDNYLWNLAPSADKGFVLSGQASPGRSGSQDSWIVKVDSNGCADTVCALSVSVPKNLHLNEGACTIFPNPSYGLSTLRVSEEFLYLETEIAVYNLNGRLISRNLFIPDRRNLLTTLRITESGIYLVSVKAGAREQIFKLVVIN